MYLGSENGNLGQLALVSQLQLGFKMYKRKESENSCLKG